MNPIVAFDETGNTGDNLLDPDQPVFVLASVQLPDEDTVRVLGDPAGEIKFAKLKRSRVGERRILSILNSSLGHTQAVHGCCKDGGPARGTIGA